MTAPGRRSPLLLVVVWLAGAVAATATGLLAVQLVGDQVGDPPAVSLTSDEVDRALAAVPEAQPPAASEPVVPPPPAPSTAPAASAARPFSNAGGAAGIRCVGGTPEVVYATPAQGYRLDEQEVEAGRAEVRFRSDDAQARLRVVCSGGQPVLESSDDD